MALNTRITSASEASLMSIVSSSPVSIPGKLSSPIISGSSNAGSAATILGSISIPVSSDIIAGSSVATSSGLISGSTTSSCSIRDSFTSELISFLIVDESIPCAFFLRDSSKFFIWKNASSIMFFSPIDIFLYNINIGSWRKIRYKIKKGTKLPPFIKK